MSFAGKSTPLRRLFFVLLAQPLLGGRHGRWRMLRESFTQE